MFDRYRADMLSLGTAMIKDVNLVTWKEKIWGAWKVLTGDAGIVLVRIKPKDFLKEEKKAKSYGQVEFFSPTVVGKIYGILDALPNSEEKLEFYDREFIVQAIIDLLESEKNKNG
jgi:hypothetical protein